MAHSDKTRDKAFRLFRKLGSTYGVAKILSVHPSTIKNWRAKFEWDDKIAKIRKKVLLIEAEQALTDREKTLQEQQSIIAQYAKDDADNLKILKAFKAICIDEINRHKANKDGTSLEIKSLKDATDVMSNVIKLERLIKGESTENTLHTISPMEAHRQDRAKYDELIVTMKKDIDDIKSGTIFQ